MRRYLWLRIVHSGDWCLRLAQWCLPSGACHTRRRRKPCPQELSPWPWPCMLCPWLQVCLQRTSSSPWTPCICSFSAPPAHHGHHASVPSAHLQLTTDTMHLFLQRTSRSPWTPCICSFSAPPSHHGHHALCIWTYLGHVCFTILENKEKIYVNLCRNGHWTSQSMYENDSKRGVIWSRPHLEILVAPPHLCYG